MISATSSSGVVRILKDLDRDITGKHVLVLEDIINSGLTLSWLLKNLGSRSPASLEVCALLRKPDAVSDALLTDGPFIEAKEHLGGLSIVRAADYDIALGWAERIAGATGLAVEIRPFEEGGPGQQPTTE